MKNIVEAIIFGFKDVLRWSVMKYIIIGGALVSALWIFLGYLLWSPIMSASGYLLNLMPFSLLRSDGAWLLSSILWLQLVLITFALIFAFFGNFILENVSKERYTKFSLIVASISAIFWGIVWFFYGSYIDAEFLKFLNWLPFETVEKGISIFIGIYFIYSAIIISMVFLASLFSEPIVADIEKRVFKEFKLKKVRVFKTIPYTIKNSIIYTLLSIVAFSFMFVPFLNFLILIGLWVWLVKDTFKYDVASLLFENVDKDELKKYNKPVLIISIFTVVLNFVPILNLFSPFIGLIAIYYYIRKDIESES